MTVSRADRVLLHRSHCSDLMALRNEESGSDERKEQLRGRYQRGYWAAYLLIPLATMLTVLLSRARHDGLQWMWIALGIAAMVRAIVGRP